jgi:hypothetical protein
MLPRFVGRGLTPLGMVFIGIGHGRSLLLRVFSAGQSAIAADRSRVTDSVYRDASETFDDA